MLAVEFGVIDVEAGEEIHPADPCTREFAASTLNYCLGFQLESENGYTYNDSEACSNPDSAQIAVNRGWIALANGAFLPNQAITSAEAAFMEKDAKAVIASANIEENYDSSYVFADWVVEISAGAEVTIDENDVVTIEGADEIIENGDTFVVYPGELPTMYLAETVTVNGDTMVITTSEADEESAVVSVDASGSVGVDLSQFEEADGVEATYIATAAQANDAIATYGIEVEKDSVIATKDIKVADGVKVSVAVNLTDLKLHQKIQTTKGNYYVSVSGTSSITGTVSADIIKANGGSSNVVLGSVRLMGVGKVTVSVDLALDGKVSVTYTGNFETGVQYNKKDGFRLVTTFKKKEFCTDSKANAKLGVKVQFGIDIIAASADLSATTGLAAKFTSHTYGDGKNPDMCTNISGWLYASVGASAKIGIGSLSKTFSKTKIIYDEKNSPVYVSYHYEDTLKVYTCSRKGTMTETGETVNYKYFTPADSKYGSSSYGGGSSTGTGSNGETYQIYTYSLDEDENATITGYKGKASVLVIPETIDGYTVTAIGKDAFKGNTCIKVLQIPDSVTKIGHWAFLNCEKLESVKLSRNLSVLGARAFGSCNSLRKIEIPKSLTLTQDSAFGYGTFDSCENLKEVTFEKGTTEIAERLFANCPGLEEIVIPDTVTIIEARAFENCTGLKKIQFSQKLETIEGHAFKGCTSLESIDLPDSITGMGTYTFEGCTSLESAKLPNTRQNIMEGTFLNCHSLKTVDIPETLTAVRNKAFGNCYALEEINLPEGVTIFEEYAFNGCSSLKKMVTPKKLTEIGNYAFGYCTSMTDVVIGNAVTKLGTGVFRECDALTNVKLGTGITYIPEETFQHCNLLERIVLPYRLKSIGENAFKDCTKFTEITIPRATSSIDSTAFSYPAKMTIYGISGTYAEEFANAQNIRFVNQEIKATEVTLSEKELQLNYGASATLALGVTPENFTDEVTWKSTDSNVAVVSDAGVVTAKGIGTAVIKVVVGDVSASCKVTVVQPVTSIRLNERSITMEAYAQKQLQATVSPENAYNRAVQWTSSDEKVASVDQNGLVTAHQKGTASIKATAIDGSGRYAECTVTVTNHAYAITEVENLESPHNYKNDCSDIWIYTKSGAKGLKVTFSEATELEEDFDYLYIYGSDADSPKVYTGKELAGKTIYVSGDTVKIKLVSDNGGTAWGFKVTKIVDAEGNIEEEAVCRISGSTRYETSLKIADAFKQQISTTKFETVIIANGRNFPDALAGSYLSGKYNAPILMASEKVQYAEPLRAYIKENLKSGGKIYVLGGTQAVPNSILEGLNGYQIVRLEGNDRYETNLRILEEANVIDEEILICTGRAFADSLSASATGKPILLVGKALTEKQKAFLQTYSDNTYYIIGGKNAVSDEIEADIQKYVNATRIHGDTRYETSVGVAEAFFDEPKTAVLAYAKNFPDGLCGGLLAMSQKAPLILAATGKEGAAKSYVQENGIENGVVLGGDGLISDNAVKSIFPEN